MSFAPAELTCDAFLDGRLRLWQPRTGYRAATDPVLLAAFVPARAGQRVLELGCQRRSRPSRKRSWVSSSGAKLTARRARRCRGG